MLTGIVLIVAGGVTLAPAFRRTPLYFEDYNPFNPWKKPVPVCAVRLIDIPMALGFFYFGLHNLVAALR